MKKIISLFLALITLITLCACSSETLESEEADKVTETAEAKEEIKKEEKETEEPLPTGEIVYPEGFSVGYNRQSIAPEVFPIQTYLQFDHVGKSNHDPCQLTCTALCDGETAFLLISVDLRGVPDGLYSYSTKVIEKATGIPAERVFINATHTHSSPDTAHLGEGDNMKAWQRLFYDRLERAVVLALHDLTPAEAYVGTAHTEGVTFVRRYLMSDGSYLTNPASKPGIPVAHETEADTELRTIRFDRGDKKDVLMVNYQTHYHGTFPDSVSADFIHPMREQVEKELDVHFVYHNGASGNLNFREDLPGAEKKYKTLEAGAAHIADTVVAATKNEEKVNVGTIQYETSLYKGRGLSGAKNVNFTAMTCGDLAFTAAPYEMFDTNGQEIRAGSPCKMTFVCAYTNGNMGYVPSAFAYPHGAYEVEISQFKEGSGEEFAQELVRMLNVCKAKG